MALKILESSENYLETIYILQNEIGNVRSIDVVKYLGFSKPSVSNAMKLLRENDYIVVDELGFITLTPLGLDVAKLMYARHEKLTEFFEFIGVNPEIAKDDACKIEHHISQESFEKLMEFLDKNR